VFDFSSVKKALTAYTGSLKKVRDDIEALERKIEDVMFAPVSKNEARSALHAFVDAQQTDFKSALVASFQELQTNSQLSTDKALLFERMRRQPLPNLGSLSLIHQQGSIDAGSLQRSLCGLFGDAMKKALSEALDSCPWPPGAILETERKQRLTELQAEMDRLKNEERELVAAAESLQIDVGAVQ